MSCRRCGGFLVSEIFSNASGLACRADVIERRCCNCGKGEGTVRTNLPRGIAEAIALGRGMKPLDRHNGEGGINDRQ